MTFKSAFATDPKTAADTAVILIEENMKLNGAAKELDKKTDGLISDHLSSQKSFKGKSGQTLCYPVSSKSGYNRIILLGAGKADELDAMGYETTGGKLYPALKAALSEKVHLFTDVTEKKPAVPEEERAAHILNGLSLASYKFEKYKTESGQEKEQPASKLAKIDIISSAAQGAKKLYDRLHAAAQGTLWARDLINEPPNMLYPESFAKMIKDELKPLGVEVEIFDEKKMEKLGFKAHLAVGMGSARTPRVVVMRWNGAAKSKKTKPLAFVGKGVTFDTGGINLKPSGGMEEMKLDMGGAAAVVGLMKTLALRKAKTDVVGIVGLAENMPSSTAYRPSDVIGSLAGKTIEVSNTDAEGRLVLADAMAYVQKTYKPQLMVDLATLTGAMMVALGFEYCGTFVNDNDMWAQMDEAGQKTGEKLWRMPLDEAYRKEMDSTIADIKTLGTSGRFAGACTAAGFLERFVEKDVKWAHMDIAGVAWIKADRPTCPKPGTGFGVRILDRMISDHYES